jgi:hypothetical protein
MPLAATTSSSTSTPRFPIRWRIKPILSPCVAAEHAVRDGQGAGKTARLASGSLWAASHVVVCCGERWCLRVPPQSSRGAHAASDTLMIH